MKLYLFRVPAENYYRRLMSLLCPVLSCDVGGQVSVAVSCVIVWCLSTGLCCCILCYSCDVGRQFSVVSCVIREMSVDRSLLLCPVLFVWCRPTCHCCILCYSCDVYRQVFVVVSCVICVMSVDRLCPVLSCNVGRQVSAVVFCVILVMSVDRSLLSCSVLFLWCRSSTINSLCS